MATKAKSAMTDTNIKVKAIRQGFYGGELKDEKSDPFYVATEAELGSWMERMDGKKNWAENRHLIPQEVVANKAFVKLDDSKLVDERTIQKKAEKDVAQAHADAKPEAEILTPAQKAANTRAKNKAAAEAKAPKKATGNTKGLI